MKISKRIWLLVLCLIQLGFGYTFAQPIIPPGVPEPGLIIWGTVGHADDPDAPLALSSVSWAVSDGETTNTYTTETKPPTQIVSFQGQSYYILNIPFDTRMFGSVELADPGPEDIQSFDLQASLPPSYTLTPTINGFLATVIRVNGATKFPQGSMEHAIDGFSASSRGQLVRVDLTINPPIDTYENWIAAFVENPSDPVAARLADADGDGFTNEDEYFAGMYPNSGYSRLQILTITPAANPGQVELSWQSAMNKTYKIEVANSIRGPWSELVSSVPSEGSTTGSMVNKNQGQTRHFYRVTVLP